MKFFIFFLFLFLSASGSSINKFGQRIKIVFRYDDYQLTSTKFNESLLNSFKKNHIPLCLGIIPFNEDGLIHNELTQEQLVDFTSRIKKGEVEVALHGFNHKDNKLVEKSFLVNPIPSEFAKLRYTDQFEKINKAKRSIDSLLNINVNIFIPPFNTYDDNTLKVLDSLKFEVISASIDGSSSSNKIKYIPSTCSDLNELSDIIKKYPNDNLVIVVLIHPYSFKGGSNYSGGPQKRIDFKQLETLLNWVNNQKYINSTTFSRLNQSEIFDNKRFVLNSVNNNLLLNILKKLKFANYGVINTVEYETSHKWIYILFNILLHIITFLFIYFVYSLITKMIKPNKAMVITYLAVTILIIFVIIYNRINSYNLITYIVFMLTIFIGMFLGLLYGNNKLKGS